MTDDAQPAEWFSGLQGTRAVSWNGLLRTVACSFILFLLLVSGINLMVDPKGLYQLVRIDGFNVYKPFQPSFTREIKALGAYRYRPDTLIFGASTVTFGVDPECPTAGLPGVSRVYNYGGQGASVSEFVATLPDLRAIGSIRRVILEARFETQPFASASSVSVAGTGRPADDGLMALLRRWIPASHAATYAENLFSWRELALSIQTVLANRKADKSFLFRSFGENGIYDQGWLRRWAAFVITEQNLLGHISNYTDFLINRAANATHVDVEYVYEAAAAAQGDGMALDIFITPVHATELILFREGGLWPLYEQFKIDLLRAIEHARERYSVNIRLFDFGTLSSATNQPIRLIDNQDIREHFSDPVHFKTGIGDMLLAVMLKCANGAAVPEGFGRELDQTVVAGHLSAERAKLDAYAAAHPELVQKIAETIERGRKRSQ